VKKERARRKGTKNAFTWLNGLRDGGMRTATFGKKTQGQKSVKRTGRRVGKTTKKKKGIVSDEGELGWGGTGGSPRKEKSDHGKKDNDIPLGRKSRNTHRYSRKGLVGRAEKKKKQIRARPRTKKAKTKGERGGPSPIDGDEGASARSFQ